MRLDGELDKETYQEKPVELDLDRAKASTRLDQLTATMSGSEQEVEQALALANQLPGLWASADEDGRREVLTTVFMGFVVGGKRVIRVDVKEPVGALPGRGLPVRAAVDFHA